MTTCRCGVYKLTVSSPQGGNPWHVWIPELTFDPGVPGVPVYRQGDAFQAIMNHLSEMMKWLPVYTDPLQSYTTGSVGVNKIVAPTYEADLWRVRVTITANPNPARIQWTPPDEAPLGGIQRFGKFNWIDFRGNPGPVLFLNENGQVFEAPGPGIRSYVVWLNPDVEAATEVTFRDVWPDDGATFQGFVQDGPPL